MKLISYTDANGSHVGVLQGDEVFNIPGVAQMQEILGDGLENLLQIGKNAVDKSQGVAVADVRIESPLKPTTMRDSMCFHEHIKNALGEVDELHNKFPAFYFSNPYAVLGPNDSPPISPGCEMFDYELEVAAVVGKPGANIPLADAEQHIIGYTMYIDWSSRDLQFEEMQARLGPAKGKDGSTTLGPVLVTADEFEAHRKNKSFDIGMRVYVNGKEMCNNNWSTINWGFDDVVTYTSRGTELRTGDVLGSGTVGTGCLVEISRAYPDRFEGWLKEGDVVRFEVDVIGEMEITVGAMQERHPLSSGH